MNSNFVVQIKLQSSFSNEIKCIYRCQSTGRLNKQMKLMGNGKLVE